MTIDIKMCALHIKLILTIKGHLIDGISPNSSYDTISIAVPATPKVE